MPDTDDYATDDETKPNDTADNDTPADDKKVDEPAEKPADTPAEKPSETPADKPAADDKPADDGNKPADASDKAADASSDKPADGDGGAPAERSEEEKADKEEIDAAQLKVDAASVKYTEAKKDDPAGRTADAKDELATAEDELQALKDKQAAEAEERARLANTSGVTLNIECHVGKATFSCYCDEDAYNASYDQVTAAVSAACSGAVFNKNPPPNEQYMFKYVPPPTIRNVGYETSYRMTDTGARCRYPRLGAFEVKATVGENEPVFVYSKVNHPGHHLPTPAQIEEMVANIQDMVSGQVTVQGGRVERAPPPAEEIEAAAAAAAAAAQDEAEAKAAEEAGYYVDPFTGVRPVKMGERLLQMESEHAHYVEYQKLIRGMPGTAEWVPPGNIHMAAMCKTNHRSSPKSDGSNSAPKDDLGATKPADKAQEQDGEPAKQ